jgi:hypothetical protein
VIGSNLHRRIADYGVPTNNVALHSRCQEDPIRIPEDFILFDCIIGVRSANKTNPKIVSLSRESISTCRVLTEPVMAGATRQSYAAAGVVQVAVSYGDIAIQFIEDAAVQENAGHTVCGSGHTGDR